jgi:hypothetical protein
MENQRHNSGNQGGEDIINQIRENISLTTEIVIKVITRPIGFFREMPKTGGFLFPIIFMAALGIIGSILRVIMSIIGLYPSMGMDISAASILLVPVFVTILGFISAAILFIIWKFMGSRESYETAFRCVAFAGAIAPITSLLHVIPYAGGLFGLVWTIYLMIIASTEVHKISSQKAWIVFCALCALLAMMSISAEYTGRKMIDETKEFQKMTSEEADTAIGGFMKEFEESQRK